MSVQIKIGEDTLQIEDIFMSKLREKLRETNNKHIVEDAFALLDYCANEIINGRKIISTDENGENVIEPQLKVFDKLK